MSDKYEFMSPDWLKMVESVVSRMVGQSDIPDQVNFTISERYEGAPSELGANPGWTLRIESGKVSVASEPSNIFDVKLTSHWEDVIKSVLVADENRHKADLMQRVLNGKTKVEGDLTSAPACLSGLHNEIALMSTVNGKSSGEVIEDVSTRPDLVGWNSNELPKPTEDLDQVKKDIKKWGYGIVLNCISGEEIERIRNRLIEQSEQEIEQKVAWLGNGGRGGNTWVGGFRHGEAASWQCIRTLPNKGRPFIELIMNYKIQECMRDLFNGRDYYLSSSNGLVIREGAIPMATHTDQIMVPGHTPLPFVGNVMITLSDFTEENGATRVVPGSHKYPPPPVALNEQEMDMYNPDEILSIPAVCPAGSAIVFEGRLWHSSGYHTGGGTRYSISTYYALPFVRQQDNLVASLHDDVYESLSEEERAMIGFKTGPFGRLDPRFPGDRTNTDINNPYIPELSKNSNKKALPVGEQKFHSFGSKDSTAFKQ